jgi:hypothetical protein
MAAPVPRPAQRLPSSGMDIPHPQEAAPATEPQSVNPQRVTSISSSVERTLKITPIPMEQALPTATTNPNPA